MFYFILHVEDPKVLEPRRTDYIYIEDECFCYVNVAAQKCKNNPISAQSPTFQIQLK